MTGYGLNGNLPSGATFGLQASQSAAVLRVGEQLAAVHPPWMTRKQAAELVAALNDVLIGWPCEHEWADIHGVMGCAICRITCPDCDGTGDEVQGAGHMFGTNYCWTCSGERNS